MSELDLLAISLKFVWNVSYNTLKECRISLFLFLMCCLFKDNILMTFEVLPPPKVFGREK